MIFSKLHIVDVFVTEPNVPFGGNSDLLKKLSKNREVTPTVLIVTFAPFSPLAHNQNCGGHFSIFCIPVTLKQMRYNRDLCPLTIVGNEGSSYYIHPAMKYKISQSKQDQDPRDEIEFHPDHWQQLYKFNSSPIHCTILPIKYTNYTDNNYYVYDQNTNILKFIIDPSARNHIITKRKAKHTIIKALPELHRNQVIKSSFQSLKNHRCNVLAILLHFAFDTKQFKLSIPTINNQQNRHIDLSSNKNQDEIILAGFISPPQSYDDFNFKQIKWMIAINRDLWIKGNYRKQPFYQLKFQCLALQQYFLHQLITQKMCHHLAKLTAENHLKFRQFVFYVK